MGIGGRRDDRPRVIHLSWKAIFGDRSFADNRERKPGHPDWKGPHEDYALQGCDEDRCFTTDSRPVAVGPRNDGFAQGVSCE